MPKSSVQARLRRAFLLALLTPPAVGCGGITTTRSMAGDAAPNDEDAIAPIPDSGTQADVSPPPGDDASPFDSSEPTDTGVPLDAHCPYVPVPAGNVCALYGQLPCDYDGGTIDCRTACPPDNNTAPVNSCFATPTDAGAILACYYCINGRRAEGSGEPPAAGVSPGSFLARCAYLEAEAVLAFERLAAELEVHGAPASLVERARHAAADEVKHARTMAGLALRHGVVAKRPVAVKIATRDLTSVIRENAVEGCVRETFGALVAMWQGARARDPQVRRALARIARDESRHAALSWDVAAWAESRLSDAAQREIDEARRQAIAALRVELGVEPSRALVEQAGVPSASDASRLLEQALEQRVFERTAQPRVAA